MFDFHQSVRIILVLGFLLQVSSCDFYKPPEPGIGKMVKWQSVSGWYEDTLADSWPALQQNCTVFADHPDWKDACAAMKLIPNPSHDQARQFYETWFAPYEVNGRDGKTEGLLTGYYEPLLFGSMVRDEEYKYPIYRVPAELLIVELGELYPELNGKRVRGRVNGNKVIPYYSREEIESDQELLAGNELVWLNDRDDVFFLHIQGSGRVQLRDGRIIGAGYANQNGHPYRAIGRVLLDSGELEKDEISLFTIRQWLREHPNQAEDLLNRNPSYVFFELRNDASKGPIGSLNVPLTPERSIAIDPKVIPLGTPVWVQTNIPGRPEIPLQRLVIAQDTGGAIKGPLRADFFWGHGPEAEQKAGIMKEKGKLLALLPVSAEKG